MNQIQNSSRVITALILLLAGTPLAAQVLPPTTLSDTTNSTLRASGVRTGVSLGKSVTKSPDHTTLLKLLQA